MAEVLVELTAPLGFCLGCNHLLTDRPIEPNLLLIHTYGCAILHHPGTFYHMMQQLLILFVLRYMLDLWRHHRYIFV